MRDAHTTSLPTVPDLDLCLDDDRVADDLRSFGHLMGILGENGFRNVDALLLKQLTCLIFVKIHVSSSHQSCCYACHAGICSKELVG